MLLTRNEFREQSLQRDKGKCIYCHKEATSVHHILERRLFEDGGYYLNNAASLCDRCHLLAEQTLISPRQLYKILNCSPVLPKHFDPNYDYTKWGDIELPSGARIKGELFYEEPVQKILSVCGLLDLYIAYVKYPRTYHLPWSENLQNDDRMIDSCRQFDGYEVVVSEKLDGENTTGYSDCYIHARSIDSDNHITRNWVKNFLSPALIHLPTNWRLCGENLFAKHSIHYHHLKSYFYLFSIWNERNFCLSWDEMQEWADLLGIEVVPILYRGIWDEEKIKGLIRYNNDNGDEVEGFVVRRAEGFSYSEFRYAVAKFVRKNHIRTDEHWMRQEVVKNELRAN